MIRRVLGLAALLALSSCDKKISNGYGVDVTVAAGPSVPPSVSSSLVALDLTVSGAETFHSTIPLPGKWTGGTARFIYRPKVAGGELVVAILGLDAQGQPVARGQGSVVLVPGSTSLLTVVLASYMAPPGDLATAPDLAPGADLASCLPESDASFCSRLGKSCESVTQTDNCDQPRTADCGSCSGANSACVANVCRAPVCADAAGNFSFVTAGTPVPSLGVANTQAALLGVSSTSASVLFLRGAPCVTTSSTLQIGDDATGTMQYTVQSLASVANLSSFTKVEETMTLSADGLTIVGVATGNNKLQQSSRSAVGAIDFGAPSTSAFDLVNAAIPAGASLNWPVLTHDGLALYFRVNNATNSALDGNYESVRASTSAQFPAATRMAGDVQTYAQITGMSDDRMTAFVTASAGGVVILSRNSLSQPFTAPTPAPSVPGSAWRVVPVLGCNTLFGTCEPGGCSNETICTWNKQ